MAPPLASAGYDDSIAGKSYHDDTKRLNEALLPHLDQGRTVIAVAHSYGVVPLSHAVNGQTVAERASRGLTGGFVSFLFIAPSPFIQAGLSMYQFAGNQWLTLSLHYLEVR